LVRGKRSGDRFDGQVGRIAVAAEMTKDDVPQTRSPCTEREIGRRAIGEVAVRGHDPLLDGERSLGIGLE
jgi:hypothetical protein